MKRLWPLKLIYPLHESTIMPFALNVFMLTLMINRS